jgi:hypothetical protein|nr:MAG TPA: ATPase-like protein [Caudoviricetes sp.]
MANETLAPVNFKVEKIEEAHKTNYVAVHVKFDGSKKEYVYVRKYRRSSLHNSRFVVVINGCEVVFKASVDGYKVVNIYRVYNTKGVKKLSTANQGGNNSKADHKDKVVEDQSVEDVKKSSKKSYKSIFNEVDVTKPVKHSKFDTIKTCLQCGIPVYLAGPAGSGKNFTVEQIAKESGWDFYFSNSVQQEFKLTGFIDAGGDFHETEFYKACTSENESVFFLDEMDASIPEVLVLLNAAIANGYFEFPTGRVNLDKVHFVAAGNTVGSGSDEMYTGRMVIDQATLDRFAIIEFGYDTNIEMAMAENDDDLVDFIHSLRKASESQGIRATFSYRCIAMTKKLENAGMPLVEVIKIAVVKGLDSDTVHTMSVKTVNEDNRFAKAFYKIKVAA